MRGAVRLRAAARADADKVIEHLLREGALSAAEKFVDALESAYARIAQFPDSGSPRYAHELGIDGLRCVLVKGFPYIAFYVVHQDRLDVLRVLHAHEDIPQWLRSD